MKKNEASHYHRLMGFGLEKDIRYCLTADGANVLPIYDDGKLVVKLKVLLGFQKKKFKDTYFISSLLR